MQAYEYSSSQTIFNHLLEDTVYTYFFIFL